MITTWTDLAARGVPRMSLLTKIEHALFEQTPGVSAAPIVPAILPAVIPAAAALSVVADAGADPRQVLADEFFAFIEQRTANRFPTIHGITEGVHFAFDAIAPSVLAVLPTGSIKAFVVGFLEKLLAMGLPTPLHGFLVALQWGIDLWLPTFLARPGVAATKLAA